MPELIEASIDVSVVIPLDKVGYVIGMALFIEFIPSAFNVRRT